MRHCWRGGECVEMRKALLLVDFEDVMVINRTMRPRLLVMPLTYLIILCYLLAPMLDSMVCADCMGNAPFPAQTTISQQPNANDDGGSAANCGAQSSPHSKQTTKSSCSICANFLVGVEVFSPHMYIPVIQYNAPLVIPPPSEFHYSINKPPQNLLS